MKLTKNNLSVLLLFILSLILTLSVETKAEFYILGPYDNYDNKKLCSLNKVGPMSIDGVYDNLLRIGVSETTLKEIEIKVVGVEKKYPDSSYYFTKNGELKYEIVEQVPGGESIIID